MTPIGTIPSRLLLPVFAGLILSASPNAAAALPNNGAPGGPGELQSTRLALAVLGSSGTHGIAAATHLHLVVQPPVPPEFSSTERLPELVRRRARQRSFERLQNFLQRGIVPPILSKPGNQTTAEPLSSSEAESETVAPLPELPDAPPPPF